MTEFKIGDTIRGPIFGEKGKMETGVILQIDAYDKSVPYYVMCDDGVSLWLCADAVKAEPKTPTVAGIKRAHPSGGFRLVLEGGDELALPGWIVDAIRGAE